MLEVLSAEAIWEFMHAQPGRVFRNYLSLIFVTESYQSNIPLSISVFPLLSGNSKKNSRRITAPVIFIKILCKDLHQFFFFPVLLQLISIKYPVAVSDLQLEYQINISF